ncbi:MAG: polya polymerase [Eubacteriales bacterium]|nr:polya polymerase [Eubacteriales bacterium]
MKLNEQIDLIDFFRQVKACQGEVLFQTSEGDTLNLASTLSQYLFTSISGNQSYIRKGEVRCQNPEDYQRLKAFGKEEPADEQ